MQPPAVTQFQLQHYLMDRMASLPRPSNPEQWAVEVNRQRKHILNDVAFHGWPRITVDSAPQFEETGVIELVMVTGFASFGMRLFLGSYQRRCCTSRKGSLDVCLPF